MKSKKKHIVISLLIICILILIIIVILNMKNKNVLYDNNGYFRGIKWGCNYNEVSLKVKNITGRHLEEDGSFGVEYIYDFDGISGVACRVRYGFAGSTYNQVTLMFNDLGNYKLDEFFNIILNKLSKKYGEYVYSEDHNFDNNSEEYTWLLKKTTIRLHRVNKKNDEYVFITFSDAN